MRDAAAGGVTAPSPSATAARTVSRSPRAFRSPGGATPAGGEAAALAEPKGLPAYETLRDKFIFVAGEWRQVRKVGPRRTSAAAVIFKPPDSAGQLPDEKWELATALKVFDTAVIHDALQHQMSVPCRRAAGSRRAPSHAISGPGLLAAAALSYSWRAAAHPPAGGLVLCSGGRPFIQAYPQPLSLA